MQEGLGIYAVELYLKVRLVCSEGMSRRQAAKHFNISRNSVAKMMSYATPPGYQRHSPIRRPKLDGFVSTIDHWLEAIGLTSNLFHFKSLILLMLSCALGASAKTSTPGCGLGALIYPSAIPGFAGIRRRWF